MSTASNASRIREYAKEILSSGKETSFGEIVTYVKERGDGTYSLGMYSGALNSLVKNENEYIRTKRGFYQKIIYEKNCREKLTSIMAMI